MLLPPTSLTSKLVNPVDITTMTTTETTKSTLITSTAKVTVVTAKVVVAVVVVATDPRNGVTVMALVVMAANGDPNGVVVASEDTAMVKVTVGVIKAKVKVA